MKLPLRAAELLGRMRARPVAWLLSAAGLALMPKCLLCLAAYAGLGALLGLTGPEICGGSVPSTAQAVPWGLGLAAVLVLLWYVARRRTPARTRQQPWANAHSVKRARAICKYHAYVDQR